jgi:phosphohistidine phosphatase
MDLLILRHGEAGKRMPMAATDTERSLTVHGREEVKGIAESIKSLKIDFDVIATSPLKRARETAEIVAKLLKVEKSLQTWDELKPEGETKDLYARLAKMKPDAEVLVVGHEPYLSGMISEVISGSSDARITLKKAGLARVEVTGFLPHPTGNLRWLLTPRIARRVA